MKKLTRMAYVNIIDKTHEKLDGKVVTYQNIKESFVDESDFNTLKLFLSVYAKGMFRVYYKEHSEEHIMRVMEFRREFYLNIPEEKKTKAQVKDEKVEYDELIKFFEEQEDYESCGRLKNSNTVAA